MNFCKDLQLILKAHRMAQHLTIRCFARIGVVAISKVPVSSCMVDSPSCYVASPAAANGMHSTTGLPEPVYETTRVSWTLDIATSVLL